MKITLNHRHHGMHAPVKAAEIPGVLADYATHLERDTYRINEEQLLAALPEGFLPVPAGQVLLVVEGDGYATGQTGLAQLCNWGKYFDAYVLGLVDEEEAAVAEEPPLSNIKLTRDLAMELLEDSWDDTPEPRDGFAFEATQEGAEHRWYTDWQLIIRRVSDGVLFASEDYQIGHTERQENDYWSGDYGCIEEEGFVHFHPVEKVAKTVYDYRPVTA